MQEEFEDYLSNLHKSLQVPVEEREGEFFETFRPYIGILPLVSVKKPKVNIIQKDIYSQYRKNYLVDLTKLIETYFPPLKVMFLPALQITKYETKNYKKVNQEYSTIIDHRNNTKFQGKILLN